MEAERRLGVHDDEIVVYFGFGHSLSKTLANRPRDWREVMPVVNLLDIVTPN